MTLKISSKLSAKKFGRKMEMLCTVMDHQGVMYGGGWHSDKLTAEFGCQAHSKSCCDKLPAPERITPQIKANIINWCEENGLKAVWSR